MDSIGSEFSKLDNEEATEKNEEYQATKQIMDDKSKCEVCKGFCKSNDGVCEQCPSSKPTQSNGRPLSMSGKHEILYSRKCKDEMTSATEDSQQQPIENKHEEGEFINRSEGTKTDENENTLSKLLEKKQSREIRLVLIGKTGVGKSATGNTILGKKDQFVSKVSVEAVTAQCKKGEREFDDRVISVIDTPGLFDNKVDAIITHNEIVRCIEMSVPGAHAFLLVVQVGRFTKEDCDTFLQLFDMFGNQMEKFAIIVFTRLDDIEADNLTVQEFVKSATPELKSFLNKCNNRILAINNREKDNTSFITELISIVNKISESNGGQCYTNEMYKKAADDLKKKIEEEDRKKREEKEREIKQIEARFDKEMKEKTKILQEQLLDKENEMAKAQSMQAAYQQDVDRLREEAKQSKNETERLRKEKEAQDKLHQAEMLKMKEDEIKDLMLKMQCNMSEKYERMERQKEEEIKRVMENQRAVEQHFKDILDKHSEELNKLVDHNTKTIEELSKVIQPNVVCTIS